MIQVLINVENFEYDIHSLVKEFFPGEDVYVQKEVRPLKEGEYYHPFSAKVEYYPEESRIVLSFFEKEEMVSREEIEVPYENRKETKNRLKQGLYKMLSAYTNTKMPWGTLTGIRPAKIPMAFLEQGQKEEEVRAYMKNTYLASQEKVDLCVDVAKEEIRLLSSVDYKNGYSLYIGIPFCPTTCLYCSFTSYPLSRWEKRIDEYIDCLEKELSYTAETFKNKKLISIYMGGGTPTTLNPQQMHRLLTMVEEKFDCSNVAEFTVEAGRPDSITREKLEVLRAHGISRISINPQTMKQETLDFIGRRHSVEQTKEAFSLARELGFDNINMDLIIGLPKEGEEDVKNTMEEIKKLDPDSVTVHSLAIKRAARLNMFREEYKELSFHNTTQIMDMTAAYAKSFGMTPYYMYRQKNMAGNFENVGYAKKEKACLYNILIMEEKHNIIAVGAGTTTKLVFEDGERIERVGNVKDVDNYISRLDEMIQRKQTAIEKFEILK